MAVRGHPKPRGNLFGIQLGFPIERDQPQPCGYVSDTRNVFEQLIIIAEPFVAGHNLGDSGLESLDLGLKYPQLPGPTLFDYAPGNAAAGRCRPAGAWRPGAASSQGWF